jgi:NADH-quinone oxidoreductase subunit L
MDKYLWLIPALPLGGFLILAFAGNYLTRKWVAMVGAGSICLSALAAIAVGSALLSEYARKRCIHTDFMDVVRSG